MKNETFGKCFDNFLLRHCKTENYTKQTGTGCVKTTEICGAMIIS
jgi:hypothetical protein